MDKLSFESTLSIDAFKAANNCSSIEVIESPKTGKLFFSTDTGISGAVSGNMDEVMANPVVSQVKGTTGSPFWMLHKKQSNNVKHTL